MAQSIFAQREETTKRGGQAGSSYSISDIETISNTNGNVMFSIPVAALPSGRGGMSVGVNLYYDSKLWDVVSPLGLVMPQGYNPSYLDSPMVIKKSEKGGWRYGIGYEFEQKRRPYTSDNDTPCYGQNAPDFFKIDVYRFVMTFPDGSSHEFTPSQYYTQLTSDVRNNYYAVDVNGTHRRYIENNANGGVWLGCEIQQIAYTGGMTFHTTDGTNLRLFVAHDNDMNPANNFWTLSMPDGSRVTQNEPITGGTAGQRIYDRNGNFVEITKQSATNTETVQATDQLGRSLTVTQVTNPTLNTREDTITSAGYNNQPLTWTVKWKKISVTRQHLIGFDPNIFQGTSNIFTANGNFDMVEEIILPTATGGLSYKFQYNGKAYNTSGDSTGFGEVSQIELPSGAKAEYEYKLNGTQTNTPHWTDVAHNPVTLKKLTYNEQYDGGQPVQKVDQWTYNITRTSSTITAPDGGVNKAYYADVLEEDGGIVTTTEAPSGAITVKEFVAHGGSNLPPWNRAWEKLVSLEYTTIRNGAGNLWLTAIRKYDYDLNGNLVRTKEYDWVPYSSLSFTNGKLNPPSNALKRTTENAYYNPTAEIVSNPSQIYAGEYRSVGSPRILNALKSTEIRDGSGTPVSRSEFFYDSLTTKGNLIETKVWDSTKQATLPNPDSNGYRLNTNNSISTTTTYDGTFGIPIFITDAKGVQTKLTYGAVNGYADLYPTQTETAYNTAVERTSTAAYDFYTGLITSATDVDNNLTSGTEYDALGRPLKVKAAVGTSSEVWTQTEYDDVLRRVVTRSDLFTKGDGKKISVQHSDQLGRVRLTRTIENAATENPYNEQHGIKVQTRYSVSGNYSYQLVSNPYRANYSSNAGSEPSMGWTRSKTINTGKHSETETFEGATLPAPFATSSANTNTTGKVQTDVDADRTLVTDQAGKQRMSRTNALGQLTDVWEITAADAQTVAVTFKQTTAAGYQTSYEYDTLNNLKKVIQGTQQANRTFSYSSLSRLTSATNPESGTINYIYDNNGNLTQKKDARLVETNYVHDALNRVTDRSYVAPANLQNYQATLPVKYIYDGVQYAKGKLTKVVTGSVSSPFSVTDYQAFDQLGRVVQSQQTTDGTSPSPMTYTYNLSGALVEQKYPSGRIVRNVLNADGDLSMVQSKKNSNSGYWNYADNFTYTATGAVSSLQLGNGRWESTQFNSRLQPTQIALGMIQGATDKLKLNFNYGTTQNNGNVQSQTITVPTVGATAGFTAVQTYTYDSLNRLKSAIENIDSNQTPSWKQTFTYDRYGNRNFDEANTTTLPKNCNGAVCSADAPVVNPTIDVINNRLNNYIYDAAGNTTKDAQSRRFTYDAEDKQTKVETVDANSNVIAVNGEYFYNGDGKRVKKIVGNEVTIFVYNISNQLVAEYSTQISATPQVSYLIIDHLGSPRINIDQNGAVTARHDYRPFGEEIQRASYGADDVRKQFTGYERDDETNLDFAQARIYSNFHGRFTGVDTGAFTPADPQNFNRYIYVQNNPIKFRDSTGKNIELSGPDAQKFVDYLEQNSGLKLKYKTKNGIITITGSSKDKNFKGKVNKEFANAVKNAASAAETAKYNVDSNVTNADNHEVVVDDNGDAWNSPRVKGELRTSNIDMADINDINQQTPEFATALVGHFLREGIEMRKPGANYENTGTPGAHDMGLETERKILSEATGTKQATRFTPNTQNTSSSTFSFVYTSVQYDMSFKSNNSIVINKVIPPTVQRPK